MILWKNARFYTMNQPLEYMDKVITDKGIIIATGSECAKYEVTEVIDLKGGYAFPGFTDAHMHLIGFGKKLVSNNIEAINEYDLILNEIIRLYNNEHLCIEKYNNCGISKVELDNISIDKYIMLRHSDYHSFTVNSKVLNDLNITSKTGILYDQDSYKVNDLWNKKDSNEILLKRTKKAIKTLYKYGITNVHTDDLGYFNGYQDTINILNDATNTYPLRVNMLVHNSVLEQSVSDTKSYNEYLNKTQVKYFYDGTISSKTALLSENYIDENHKGTRVLAVDEFDKIVKMLRSRALSIAVHAIGDQATNEITSVLSRNKNPNLLLDRIIHVSLATKETINNFTMNTAIDIQPLFIKSDYETIQSTINNKILSYPFAQYIKKGIIINSSSDAPVESVDPLETFKIIKDIKRYDLVKSYTVNPGVTINQKEGKIMKGYKADFTIFNKDLLDEKIEINQIKVIYTVINEKVVHSIY